MEDHLYEEKDFVEALKKLAEKHGVSLPYFKMCLHKDSLIDVTFGRTVTDTTVIRRTTLAERRELMGDEFVIETTRRTIQKV